MNNNIDRIEHTIQNDFKNMPLLDVLGLQNLFYYYDKQNAEEDYIFQLLKAEIEKRLR